MSNEIKPFYCKPSSYDEAVEICERAIANGAIKLAFPTIDNWSIFNYWGVAGWLFTSCSVLNHTEKSITIQKVRELYPHPSYDNNEFVPDLGEVVLASWGTYRNVEVEVSAYRGNKVWVTCCGLDEVMHIDDIEFRPLKTEFEIKAEKQTEEIRKDLEEFYGQADCPQPYDTAKHLQSKGYIKPRWITIEETKDAAESFAKENDGDVMDLMLLLGFTEGAHWAEKRIKGEV